jgi:hypothetical protein
MSWTYQELRDTLTTWAENNSQSFEDQLDTFIMLAEWSIFRSIDMDIFRKYATANLTAGDRFLTKPDDFFLDRWMKIEVDDDRYFLDSKDNSFMDTFWTDLDATDVPRYYSDWDERNFVLAPTPDAGYLVEMAYISKPDGLSSDQPTTWISENAPNALFCLAMVEAKKFTKNPPDEIALWQQYADRALSELNNEQVVRQRRGEGREGENRGRS